MWFISLFDGHYYINILEKNGLPLLIPELDTQPHFPYNIHKLNIKPPVDKKAIKKETVEVKAPRILEQINVIQKIKVLKYKRNNKMHKEDLLSYFVSGDDDNNNDQNQGDAPVDVA